MTKALTDDLLACALDLGAASVGMTSAGAFARETEAIHRAKRLGRAGPLRFTYDEPAVAGDITVSFGWAKSLIVIGSGYLPASTAPSGAGALIARFATSDHYRQVRQITGALVGLLEGEGFRSEAIIDDNRLIDRAAAVRAGVGWQGKSTMVLTPGVGPWMLLGSVITDAALRPTSRMKRDCGTCSACIPACPTGALDAAGLDARRCLSTWLQTAGSIPLWIRPLLGRRVYGCDDCLTSCPPGFKALEGIGSITGDLAFDSLLTLTDEELLSRFSWWYVPRREGRFIRRNLLVAAGNSGETKARDAVVSHIEHPSSMIRGHAYWALARGYPETAQDLLAESALRETVVDAQDELTTARLMLDDPVTYAETVADSEAAAMMLTSS